MGNFSRNSHCGNGNFFITKISKRRVNNGSAIFSKTIWCHYQNNYFGLVFNGLRCSAITRYFIFRVSSDKRHVWCAYTFRRFWFYGISNLYLGNWNYWIYLCSIWRPESGCSIRFYKCDRFINWRGFDTHFRINGHFFKSRTIWFNRKPWSRGSFCNNFYRNDVGTIVLLGN